MINTHKQPGEADLCSTCRVPVPAGPGRGSAVTVLLKILWGDLHSYPFDRDLSVASGAGQLLDGVWTLYSTLEGTESPDFLLYSGNNEYY